MWTKEQYLEWLTIRGDDPSQWTAEDCRNAYQLIREVALANLAKCFEGVIFRELINFTLMMARKHYGFMEVDQLLTYYECYPPWMNGEVTCTTTDTGALGGSWSINRKD